MKLSRKVAGGFLLITSAVTGIGLAELTVAVFKPQPVYRILVANTPAMHVKGDILPHVLRPAYRGRFIRQEFNTGININSRGFRGAEFRQGDGPRLVIIGDSFTFGHGVEDSEAYPAILSSMFTNVEVINADKPQKEFSAFFSANGIGYLDLLPAMKLYPDSLYYPVDRHWNARGHKLAAEIIGDWLCKVSLIECNISESRPSGKSP
jgi:hypothetical protein